jgi:hypothetical protein
VAERFGIVLRCDSKRLRYKERVFEIVEAAIGTNTIYQLLWELIHGEEGFFFVPGRQGLSVLVVLGGEGCLGRRCVILYF